jgi:hypothetical protein
VRFRLAGGIGVKLLKDFLASMTNIANDECEAIQTQHALD